MNQLRHGRMIPYRFFYCARDGARGGTYRERQIFIRPHKLLNVRFGGVIFMVTVRSNLLGEILRWKLLVVVLCAYVVCT